MKKVSKEEFEAIVKECYTIADVCRKIGWKPLGSNYKIVHKYIDEYGLDVSHFTGQKTNIGNKLNKHREKGCRVYLKENTYITPKGLKWKLFSEGLKEYKCEICGCNDWNGGQISLQLHHINGDDTDNRLENLQILCPNCHSQTDNFCGRNIINMNPKYSKKYYCRGCSKEIEKTLTNLCDDCYKLLIKNELNTSKITSFEKVRRFSQCKECGKEVWHGSKLCNECSKKKSRKVERPTKEELDRLIHEKSFLELSRMYGVSDTAIRKWCSSYDLPHRKRDMV